MVYLRAYKKWYKTKFKDHNDITMMAWDYIDMMYNDESKMFVRRVVMDNPDDINAEALKLEIWMQGKETMTYFNEKKFNNHISHFEETGQRVRTDYGL